LKIREINNVKKVFSHGALFLLESPNLRVILREEGEGGSRLFLDAKEGERRRKKMARVFSN